MYAQWRQTERSGDRQSAVETDRARERSGERAREIICANMFMLADLLSGFPKRKKL